MHKIRLHLSTTPGQAGLLIVAPPGVFSEEAEKLLGARLHSVAQGIFKIIPLPGEKMAVDKLGDYELTDLEFATIGPYTLMMVTNPSSHDKIKVMLGKRHAVCDNSPNPPDPSYAAYHGLALGTKPRPN